MLVKVQNYLKELETFHKGVYAELILYSDGSWEIILDNPLDCGCNKRNCLRESFQHKEGYNLEELAELVG